MQGIGITGLSGGGKTTIAQVVCKLAGAMGYNVPVLGIDMFYYPLDVIALQMGEPYDPDDDEAVSELLGSVEWDHPERIDFSRLIHTTGELLSEKQAVLPRYNKDTGLYEPDDPDIIRPGDALILEGIFVYSAQFAGQIEIQGGLPFDPVQIQNQINGLFPHAYFVYCGTPPGFDEACKRRMQRDGFRDPNETRRQWHDFVLPAYNKYIDPLRKNGLLRAEFDNTNPSLGDVDALVLDMFDRLNLPLRGEYRDAAVRKAFVRQEYKTAGLNL